MKIDFKRFAKIIQKFVNLFFYYFGFYYILKFINRKKVRILMYHGVDNYQTNFNLDDPSLVTPIKNFEKQIKYLNEHYNIISLHDLVNHIKKEIPFPKSSAVITFDDGLKNNFVNAFSILRKYDITATVFLITDYIDTLKISWLNKFYYIIKKISLNKFAKEFNRKFPVYSILIRKVNKKDLIEYIKFLLKYKVDDGVREKFIQDLYDKFKIRINKKTIKDLYLSWEEIKKMNKLGISFGSHTCTHPALSTLNHKKVKKEIINSKRKIETKLHKQINLFAYPYGNKDSFNLNIKQILANNNFLCAVSTIDGFNNLNSDLYELKRICIINEPLYYFKLRIEGFEGFIGKIYQKLSNYFRRIVLPPKIYQGLKQKCHLH